MKKLLSVLMALLIMCSFAACNTDKDDSSKKEQKETSSTNAVEDNNTEETDDIQSTNNSDDPMKEVTQASQYVENVLGSKLSNYEKKEDFDYGSISYKFEEKETDLVFDLTIDGFNVKAGTLVKDMIDAGYTMGNADYEVEAYNAVCFFSMTNEAKGIKTKIEIYNDTNSTKVAKDCKIIGMINDAQSINYVDYQGLTAGSSLEDIIKVLGEPSSIYISQISDNDPYITVDYNGPFENGSSLDLNLELTYVGDDTELYSIDISRGFARVYPNLI